MVPRSQDKDMDIFGAPLLSALPRSRQMAPFPPAALEASELARWAWRFSACLSGSRQPSAAGVGPEHQGLAQAGPL